MELNEKDMEIKIMPYRFWLFVSLTAFLVITFVYYLPLRFQHIAREHMEEQMGGAMHERQGGVPYHEESEIQKGLVVNFNVTPVPVFAGTSTRLDFFVNEKPGNAPVAASSLEIEHTKLMHVIGVRNDMEEFFHIHPVELRPGLFSLGHAFVKPGLYKIWSEIKKDGIQHTFGHPEFSVEGVGSRYKKEVFFPRSVIVGNYQVLLHYDEPIVKGRNTNLNFVVHDVVGRKVEVELYLGADMHLTLIKDDWKQFIHTHPTDQGVSGDHHSGLIPAVRAHGVEDEGGGSPPGTDKEIGFEVVFQEAGIYKAFAQFRPKGIDLPLDEALSVSFWIKVEEKVPLAAFKWTLAGISLVLIVLLSLAVKKYLDAQNLESR